MTTACCDERHPDDYGFICCEPRGHDGPHVCLGGLTWPDHDGTATPIPTDGCIDVEVEFDAAAMKRLIETGDAAVKMLAAMGATAKPGHVKRVAKIVLRWMRARGGI